MNKVGFENVSEVLFPTILQLPECYIILNTVELTLISSLLDK